MRCEERRDQEIAEEGECEIAGNRCIFQGEKFGTISKEVGSTFNASYNTDLLSHTTVRSTKTKLDSLHVFCGIYLFENPYRIV